MDRNLRNLEGLTGPLGEKGEGMVTRIDQTIARLDDLLGQFSDFGRKLNQGEGSLGMLMRNPDLYQHLNAAALNIEKLTLRHAADPGRRAGVHRQDRPPSRVAGHSRRNPAQPRHEMAAGRFLQSQRD